MTDMTEQPTVPRTYKEATGEWAEEGQCANCQGFPGDHYCAASVPAPEQDEAVRRTSYLHVTDFERLEEWCRLVRVVTGEVPYLVGSVHTSPDYRDVDLRVILPDPVFDRWWSDPLRVRLVNRALSTWGRQETGLPIDLQVQRQTEANRDFPGFRNPMGLRDWSVQRTSGVPALATPPPVPAAPPEPQTWERLAAVPAAPGLDKEKVHALFVEMWHESEHPGDGIPESCVACLRKADELIEYARLSSPEASSEE